MGCPYCYEGDDGSVGHCIQDECVACCACGRVLLANRADELEVREELWKPEGSVVVDGCQGTVCGWWPCQCEGGDDGKATQGEG